MSIRLGRPLITATVQDNEVLSEFSGESGVDASTGTAQNGPGFIGTKLGVANEPSVTQNYLKFDAGNHVHPRIGSAAKCIPIMIEGPYVLINGEGNPEKIDRLIGIALPHFALNSVGGPVEVGDTIHLFLDGSFDVNPEVVQTGRQFSVYAGHDIGTGGSFWVGGNDTSRFIDFNNGENAPAPGEGHSRLRYNGTHGSYETSVEGGQYRPLALALNWFAHHDPVAATAYQPGETVLHTITPASANPGYYKGLRSIIPHRWTLPAATCGLVPGIRIIVNYGSSQLFQNTTETETQTGRDSVYLAQANSYTVEVRFVVTNPTENPVTADLGYFQFEGTFV